MTVIRLFELGAVGLKAIRLDAERATHVGQNPGIGEPAEGHVPHLRIIIHPHAEHFRKRALEAAPAHARAANQRTVDIEKDEVHGREYTLKLCRPWGRFVVSLHSYWARVPEHWPAILARAAIPSSFPSTTLTSISSTPEP